MSQQYPLNASQPYTDENFPPFSSHPTGRPTVHLQSHWQYSNASYQPQSHDLGPAWQNQASFAPYSGSAHSGNQYLSPSHNSFPPHIAHPNLHSMSMNTDSAALSNCTSAIVNTVQPHVNDSVSRSERPAVRGAKRKRQGLPEPERQIRRRTIADSIQPTSVVAHGVGPFDVREIAELLSEGRISELQELLDASWGEQLASDSENQDNLEDNAN